MEQSEVKEEVGEEEREWEEDKEGRGRMGSVVGDGKNMGKVDPMTLTQEW